MKRSLGIAAIFVTLATFPSLAYGWTRTYGGNKADAGECVQQTFDGGFIITGWTESFGAGESDLWLIKTDTLGAVKWSHTYGEGGRDKGLFVQQTPDSGFIVVGKTSSFSDDLVDFDLWLLRINPRGDIQWSTVYGGHNDDVGTCVYQLQDGGYFICGYTESFGAGGQDVWLLRSDAEGHITAQSVYGGEYDDWANFMGPVNNDYYVVGGTQSFGNGSGDIWFLVAGASCDTSFTRTYGGECWEEARSAALSSSWPPYHGPGHMIVGVTNTYTQGDDDLWGVMTNTVGDKMWTRAYGDSGNQWANSIVNMGNDSYVTVGETHSADEGNLWLVAWNKEGFSPWKKTYGGAERDGGSFLQTTGDQGCIITGYTCSFGAGDRDIWLIRTDSLGDTLPHEDWPDPDDPDDPDDADTLTWKILNPIGDVIQIEYGEQGFQASVYDGLGRRVDRLASVETPGSIMWGEDKKSGVYFFRVDSDTFFVIQKVVLIH